MNDAPINPALTAIPLFSGFEQAHDTYHALSKASDGKIYYVLSSDSIFWGGRFYCYDPGTGRRDFLGDLTEICGEKNLMAIPQGKSHVEFYEHKGRLYFATHVGFYEIIDGIERLPQNVPPGYSLYPGGHFLSYDLTTGEFDDLAMVEDEGILTLVMDTQRGQLYGITWPSGNFVHFNNETKELKNLGRVSGKGEAGIPGADYRVLCRSLFVDPATGHVYGSTAEGYVFTYGPGLGMIQLIDGLSLRLDYFGQYDHTRPGSMAYNWRKILWHEAEGVAYGVHGNSGYLFCFDPRHGTLELVERITSEPSRKSGMYDQFTYGYLGLQFGPDGNTLFYLTGGPVYEKGRRLASEDQILVGAKGIENLHLVTYHIPSGKYMDHGPIFYEDGGRPTYVNAIAVGDDQTVYTLARFDYQGNVIQDLVKISTESLHIK